jgi:hypothetical protein
LPIGEIESYLKIEFLDVLLPMIKVKNS